MIDKDIFKHLGDQEYFIVRWPHLNTGKWPGRELKFAYCHPAHTVLLSGAVIWEVIVTFHRVT